MNKIRLIVFVYFFPALLMADSQVSSSEQRTHVIELYTSEGCSSCPPAERFLNKLNTHPDLWKQFIPLAFHVDYWNYLGWRDPYSSEQHAQRQRNYASVLQQNTIYTPAFMVDGKFWRAGSFNALPTLPSQPGGILTMSVKQHTVSVEYQNKLAAAPHWVLNLAVVGSGLVSQITRGENAGSTAQHDFVVLSHQHYDYSRATWQVAKPALPALAKQAQQLKLVAWVSTASNPAPLQAVAMDWPVE